MINTSNAYKEAIKKNREFSIHDAVSYTHLTLPMMCQV